MATPEPAAPPQLTRPRHHAGDRARDDPRGGQHLPRPVRRPDDRHRDSGGGGLDGACCALLGGGSILENNIVQTGASAGSSIAAGVIFTDPGAGHPGLLAGLQVLVGARDRRPRRLARRAVLGAAAALDDRRSAAAVPGRQGGGRSAQGRRESRRRRLKILGISALIGGSCKLIAASGLRLIPDSALARGFVGKYLGYMGTNLSPALLGVGYIVGLNIGIVVVSRQHPVLATSRSRSTTRSSCDSDPELAAQRRRRDRRRDARVRDLVGARSATSASARC